MKKIIYILFLVPLFLILFLCETIKWITYDDIIEKKVINSMRYRCNASDTLDPIHKKYIISIGHDSKLIRYNMVTIVNKTTTTFLKYTTITTDTIKELKFCTYE